METGHRHKDTPTLSLLFLLPGDWAPWTWGDQVAVSKVHTFTVLLVGQERPRKGPGWTTRLSWLLNSQPLLSQVSFTLGCIINTHYALCLRSTFCQVLYHSKKYF